MNRINYVPQNEENLAAFVGTKYAVGLNSGYDALHISLRAAGIGPGDEAIVPAHTFMATCSVVVNVGAKPILVDVGKDFNIDCDKIEEVLKSAIIKLTQLPNYPFTIFPLYPMLHAPCFLRYALYFCL